MACYGIRWDASWELLMPYALSACVIMNSCDTDVLSGKIIRRQKIWESPIAWTLRDMRDTCMLRPLQPVCRVPHQSSDASTFTGGVLFRSAVCMSLKNASLDRGTKNYMAIRIFVSLGHLFFTLWQSDIVHLRGFFKRIYKSKLFQKLKCKPCFF